MREGHWNGTKFLQEQLVVVGLHHTKPVHKLSYIQRWVVIESCRRRGGEGGGEGGGE